MNNWIESTPFKVTGLWRSTCLSVIRWDKAERLIQHLGQPRFITQTVTATVHHYPFYPSVINGCFLFMQMEFWLRAVCVSTTSVVPSTAVVPVFGALHCLESCHQVQRWPSLFDWITRQMSRVRGQQVSVWYIVSFAHGHKGQFLSCWWSITWNQKLKVHV